MFKKLKRSITKKYLRKKFGISLNELENLKEEDRYLLLNKEFLDDFKNSNKAYSQFGEDLIITLPLKILLNKKVIGDVSYLDIGGNRTKQLSNTYYFYKMGYSGVIIEPNKDLFKKFLIDRPRDVSLNVGIHFTNEEIDKLPFYQFENAYDGLSTFSKEEFEYTLKKLNNIPKYEAIETPILKVNDIIQNYMNDKAPTFVSLDTEGIDLEILESFDFTKYKPIFFIIETAELSQTTFLGKKLLYIEEFMLKNGYQVYADTYINTIFINKNILGKLYE